MHERISRDDALVAWAAANSLYGVTLGETQTSTIVKAHAKLLDRVTAFFYYNDLSNPFPELSAIKAISGPGSDRVVENYKYGLGLRLVF
jgi:hypothetical protein